jgi:hypothetical protein
MPQTKTMLTNDIKIAALPTSFARPERGCCSVEILFTTASIRLLSNSTINIRKTVVISKIWTIGETGNIKAAGIRMTATANSIQEAIS